MDEPWITQEFAKSEGSFWRLTRWEILAAMVMFALVFFMMAYAIVNPEQFVQFIFG